MLAWSIEDLNVSNVWCGHELNSMIFLTLGFFYRYSALALGAIRLDSPDKTVT